MRSDVLKTLIKLFVAPIIVSFFVGIALWSIQKEKTALEYNLVVSESFPLKQGMGKYFVYELKNTGNRPVENIVVKIEANDGIIDSIKFSNADLFLIQKSTDEVINGKIPLLNLTERIGAVITLSNIKDSSSIKADARAVGATAMPKNSNSDHSDIFSLLLALFSGLITFLILRQIRVEKSIEKISDLSKVTENLNSISKKSEDSLEEFMRKSQKSREEEREEHEKRIKEIDQRHQRKQAGEPDTPQIVFSIINKCGLSKILPSLMNTSGSEIRYWSTAFFLMHQYLLDKENADKYVEAMDKLTNTASIAASSKGLLLYLAGKIESLEGNRKQAADYFEKCRVDTPLMYEHLMAQDPTYDIASIETAIKNRQ